MQDSTSESGLRRSHGISTRGAPGPAETEHAPGASGIPWSRCGQRCTAAFWGQLAHSLGVGLPSGRVGGVVLGAWAARSVGRSRTVDAEMLTVALALPQGKPGDAWAQSSADSKCGPRRFRRITSRTIGHPMFTRSPCMHPDEPVLLRMQDTLSDDRLLSGSVPQVHDWVRAWRAARSHQSWRAAAEKDRTEHFVSNAPGRSTASRPLEHMALVMQEVIRPKKKGCHVAGHEHQPCVRRPRWIQARSVPSRRRPLALQQGNDVHVDRWRKCVGHRGLHSKSQGDILG